MKIEVIEHFTTDDKDFYGDYYSIEIRIDDKEVKHYGDHYHDKGRDKVKGFIDGLEYLIPNFNRKEVIYSQIADIDD